MLRMGLPLFRDELHEHLFQAQAHRPQLQELPALLHDGPRHVSPHIALFGRRQGVDGSAARVGPVLRHAEHPWETLQVGQDSRLWPLHFKMNRAIGLRTLRQVVGRIDRHNLAIIDNDHPVTGHAHFGENMGAEDNRMVVPEVFNGLADVDDPTWIESYSGLIENEHRTIVEERLRQTHALAIAFREIANETALHFLHAAEFHHLTDFAGALAPRNALHFSDEVQVAADGHFPVQRHVLWQIADPLADFERLRKDIVAGDHGASTTGWHEAGQDTHRSRFPGAVGSQETQNLSWLDAEGEIPDRGHGTIVFTEVIHLDHPVLSSCVPFNPLSLA